MGSVADIGGRVCIPALSFDIRDYLLITRPRTQSDSFSRAGSSLIYVYNLRIAHEPISRYGVLLNTFPPPFIHSPLRIRNTYDQWQETPVPVVIYRIKRNMIFLKGSLLRISNRIFGRVSGCTHWD